MTIHQKFTGDTSQLLKAYQDLSQANTRLEQQVGNLARKMGEGAKAGKSGIDSIVPSAHSATRSLATMAAGYLSLSSAIGLVNQRLEHKNRLLNENLNTQTKLAPAQVDLFLNTYGKSEAEISQIRRGISDVSKETDVNEEYVTPAFNAVQGTGIGNTEQHIQAVRSAAKVAWHRPDTIGSIGKSILMFQDLGGVTADEALSINLQAGAASFVENPESASRMLRQSAASSVASSKGDRRKALEQALEFSASISQMVGEERGESATTATGQISGQLNEAFTKGIEVTGPYGHKRRIKAKHDPGTLIDRWEYMQNDPRFAKAFIENKMSVETKYKAPLENAILDKNGRDAQIIRNNQKAISYDTTELPALIQRVNKGTPQIELARSQQRTAASVERFHLDNPTIGRQAAAKKSMTEALDKTSEFASGPYLLRGVNQLLDPYTREMADDVFGRDSLESSTRALQERREDILRKPGWLMKGHDSPIRQESELSSTEKDALKLVDKAIAEIKTLQANNGETAAAVIESNRLLTEQNGLMREILSLNRGQPTLVPTAARAERGGQREQ